MVEIFNDDFLSSRLAFRGGTALHKLYLSPQSRYSEDIDLVQTQSENIGETFDKLRKVLAFLGKPKVLPKRNNNTMIFRVDSTASPGIHLRLKVEINCKEHFSVLGLTKLPFEVNSSWFSGKCEIVTYQLDELLGTKFRALYQRKKGRDLFDLYKALENPNLNPENVLKCYHKYMSFEGGKSPSQAVYLANMEEKMQRKDFLDDMIGLLRPEVEYNPQKAYEVVKRDLIEKL